jgi:hypothetical protein
VQSGRGGNLDVTILSRIIERGFVQDGRDDSPAAFICPIIPDPLPPTLFFGSVDSARL